MALLTKLKCAKYAMAEYHVDCEAYPFILAVEAHRCFTCMSKAAR